MNTKDSIQSSPKDDVHAPSAYDRILYPQHAYNETHPDHLAVIGVLFGMNPPPVDNCRVLEIGCSAGGNLLPMAAGLPRSEFWGIDLAAGPIETAQGIIDRAALENVRVRAMDLMEITPEFGHFDYIIAHGFYSWVPANVQQKLFDVCRNNLSPNGIAFVSYNTYPEGHIRRISRDMLLFHMDGCVEDTGVVNKGKDFLTFMRDSINGMEMWKAILWSDLKRLQKRDDNVTYHDELSPAYYPVYFTDFIESAEHHGLQFLGEAKLRDMIDPPVKPDVAERIRKYAAGNLIRQQQYLDFLLFRGFRRTLLCHREVSLERNDLAGKLTRLWVASPLKRTTTKSDSAVEFINSRGPGTITRCKGTALCDPVFSEVWLAAANVSCSCG